MSSKFHIVQISDTHLFGDKNRKINGSNSYLNFKKVMIHISNLEPKPNLIIVSGDLSQDCTFESYQLLANLLNKGGIRYYLLPGNHDDVSIINKVFEYSWVKDNVDYFLNINGWLLFIIDTSVYPEDGGELSEMQLENIKKILGKNKEKPTIVFMHHHPLLVNSAWIDKMILKRADEFNNLIKVNPQVKAVLFGHIHQVFEKNLNGAFYASAPSTCYQVLPETQMFTVEKITPGYRLIEINGDKLSSKVLWLE